MHLKEKITNRVDLNLGYTCNINCRFCYYQKRMRSKRKKDLTTDESKEILRYIRIKGKTAVDLTGGEPTIRKDLIELVEYAKFLGFKTICIITNGLRLADKKYTEELISAGVNDILFSLHGHTPEIHDYLTDVKGSFQRLIKGIENVMSINPNIVYRNNCVVNRVNYKYIPELTSLLHSLNFKTINFILFNPTIEAHYSTSEIYVPYSLTRPYLIKAIDTYKDKIPKITIRYMPFCILEEYASYITNMPQIQYDPDEWDYIIRHNTREGKIITFLASIIGILFLPWKRISTTDFYTLRRDGIKRFFALRSCVKSKACKICKYDYICYGLWREYAKYEGFHELKAIIGKKEYRPYCIPSS